MINNLVLILCFLGLVFLFLFINMSERVFLLLKFSFPQDGFTHKHHGKKKPCWYVLTCVVQHCWAVRISWAYRMSGLILCFQEDAVIGFFAFDDLAVEKFQCLSAARTESHSCLLTMITCACILTVTQICLNQITVWNLVSGKKYEIFLVYMWLVCCCFSCIWFVQYQTSQKCWGSNKTTLCPKLLLMVLRNSYSRLFP